MAIKDKYCQGKVGKPSLSAIEGTGVIRTLNMPTAGQVWRESYDITRDSMSRDPGQHKTHMLVPTDDEGNGGNNRHAGAKQGKP